MWDANDLAAGPLQVIDMRAVSSRYGTRTVALLRSALQDVLLGALDQPPRLGYRCVGIERTDTTCPRLRFATGDVEEADVIIAADGIRSAVRAFLFPNLRLRYSGQTSWRGVVDVEPATEPGVAYEYWTGGFRLGFARVAPHRTYWFTALDAPEGERGDPAQELEMLGVRSRGFPAHVGDLLARTDPAAVVHTDLHDLMPPRHWSRGSIVLLGDAVHATTPNLGQGGAQALEDALALADAIAAHGAGPRAFAAYERVRRAKAVDPATMVSRLHEPPGDWTRSHDSIQGSAHGDEEKIGQEVRYSEVRSRSKQERRERHAPQEAWHAQEREVRERRNGEEPQTGHRDRPLRGTEEGSEGTAEEELLQKELVQKAFFFTEAFVLTHDSARTHAMRTSSRAPAPRASYVRDLPAQPAPARARGATGIPSDIRSSPPTTTSSPTLTPLTISTFP